MSAIHVYTKERGVRKLKEGVTLERYQERFPHAIKVCKPPCTSKLETWNDEGGCKALDGCWVEPDGECEHGFPSWLRALNMI